MPLFSVAEFDRRFVQYRSALEFRARKRVSQEDAEDAVSECYRQARLSLDAYRPERDLFAWLIGILENQLRQQFRRVRIRREDFCSMQTESGEIVDVQTPRSALQEAAHRELLNLLGQIDLTARQYECLVRTLADESQRQIGKHLGISQRMVSGHIQAAQEQLRRAAAKNGDGFDPVAFFYECAQHPIYRKPHSFDNQSNSQDRERQRHACLGAAKRVIATERPEAGREKAKGERQKEKVSPL